MGMFDYINCEMALPDPQPPAQVAAEWQTKCTPDQLLTTYTIRSDGTLWREPRYEGVPKQLFDYHGDIHFYGGGASDWWSYRARFSNGVAVITLKEHPTALPQAEEG